ncbi:50S ribosomal protein L23 [Candidatus Micrarchaeota archaeon]|nr:50S ribosomal protein L23 [Candidatus Micrarchaeota archaeon]MBD3418269.1 50S ribosomal protein L23 [Candidatus Micrarchaeota archaeon]
MILKEPVKTEKAIGKIEFDNTITFKVEEKATKKEVKDEVEKLFSVKVKSVRTYTAPLGGKRAVVRLAEGHKAEDISSKLKMA